MDEAGCREEARGVWVMRGQGECDGSDPSMSGREGVRTIHVVPVSGATSHLYPVLLTQGNSVFCSLPSPGVHQRTAIRLVLVRTLRQRLCFSRITDHGRDIGSLLTSVLRSSPASVGSFSFRFALVSRIPTSVGSFSLSSLVYRLPSGRSRSRLSRTDFRRVACASHYVYRSSSGRSRTSGETRSVFL